MSSASSRIDRADAENRICQELNEDTSGPQHQNRAEARILEAADDDLVTRVRHPFYQHLTARQSMLSRDRRYGRISVPNGRSRLQIQADSADIGLVSACPDELHDNRRAELVESRERGTDVRDDTAVGNR